MAHAETNAKPKRQALLGGCHCGRTRYVLFLTLPSPFSESHPPGPGEQRISRCNCTTCHKMGLFHVKPGDPHDDFLLLSPLDPLAELGDYLTEDRVIHFLFCKSCGVRCLTLCGTGEVEDVDLHELGVPGYATAGPGEARTATSKAWRVVPGSGRPDYGTSVLVNGHTIDAGQPAFDMRELTEKKLVRYLDTFSEIGEDMPPRWDRPHEEGCY